MFSNTGFNSEQSVSTDSSMKECDIVKPAAKPSSNSDTRDFHCQTIIKSDMPLIIHLHTLLVIMQ